MSRSKKIRQQRLTGATRELNNLRGELAFEQISVILSDGGKHWRFKYGATHIASYWPASSRGKVFWQQESTSCESVAQAQRLAVRAKQKLFATMSNALNGSAVFGIPASL